MSDGSVKWVMTQGDVTVEVVATIVGTNVEFKINLVSGIADLQGFFIDFFNDGGDLTSIGSKSNNMNGSSSNEPGVKLDGFDFAEGLGTVGGSDADYVCGTVTISLADLATYGVVADDAAGILKMLAEAQVGIRATSVGEDREGSLKLTDIGEYVCPPGDDTDDYPEDFPLSNATLIFNATDATALLDKNGDGYIAVKIDSWDQAQIDFDDDEAAVLAKLAADLGLSADDFLGAILKGGNGDTLFYAYGDDDPDPDPFPAAPLGYSGDGDFIPGGGQGKTPVPVSDATYWLNYPPEQGNIDDAVVDVNYVVDEFVFV